MDENQSKQYDTIKGRDELRSLRLRYGIGLFVTIVLLGISIPIFLISKKYGIIPLGIGLLSCFLWVRIMKQYTAVVKDLTGQTLNKIDYLSEVSYDPNGSFNLDDLQSLGMLKKGIDYKMGDLVSAKCNDIPFKMCDLKIEEQKKSSNGSTINSTFFRGKFIVFHVKRKFDASALIYTNQFKGIGNGLPETMSGTVQPAPAAGNGNTETDDGTPKPFINITEEILGKTGKFQVLTSNGQSNSNIFTDSLFSNLMTVSQKLKVPFALMFKEDKIFIAINDNKDMFEITLANKPDAAPEEQRIKQEMDIVPFLAENIADHY